MREPIKTSKVNKREKRRKRRATTNFNPEQTFSNQNANYFDFSRTNSLTLRPSVSKGSHNERAQTNSKMNFSKRRWSTDEREQRSCVYSRLIIYTAHTVTHGKAGCFQRASSLAQQP